ncbi:lipoprotein [Streptosporangium violaceochromogenes]|nr:lipoprotein [Streptosporangium violaceochromogenes]
MRVKLVVAALVIVPLALSSLTACDATPAPAGARSTVPVIVPGGPGEAARTIGPEEAATAVPTPTANAADVKYVQDMIVHHRQALDMSTLAPARAASERLRALAARIKDSQGPEIRLMASWLREQGQRLPGHHVTHTAMPGMATPEEMEALAAASGQEFDRLFLRLMIAHHQGAITMSEEVLTHGSHLRIEELANEISATQAGEIHRMLRMRTAP